MLDRDDRQDRGDEAEGARTGEDPVGQPQKECPAKAVDVEPVQPAAGEGALLHTEHPQGDPDQNQADNDLPVASHIPQHPTKERADNADDGDRDEQSRGKKDGILGGLPRLEHLLLSRHIGHDQRDGGQMARTQQDADHAP